MSIVWAKYDLCLRFNASPRICKYQICLKSPNSEPLFERLSSTCNQIKMWTASMTTTRTKSCVFHAARVSSRVVWRLFVVTDDAVASARGVAICPVAVYHNGCGVVRWCWWWSSCCYAWRRHAYAPLFAGKREQTMSWLRTQNDWTENKKFQVPVLAGANLSERQHGVGAVRNSVRTTRTTLSPGYVHLSMVHIKSLNCSKLLEYTLH